MTRMRQAAGDDRGAAMVEMALVLSVLLVVLLGIVQFGLAFHVQQAVLAAANEGARLASLPESTSVEVADRVRAHLGEVLTGDEACPPATPGQFCIAITPGGERPCNLRRGDLVTVDVRARTRIDIPLWASPELTLAGRGVYRCEG